MLPHDQPGFDRILDYLRQERGVDFSAYKSSSLMRRVRKRMETIEIHRFDAYLDRLQVHPDEFAALFNTILINVTSFFRDAEVWEALRATVLPELVAAERPMRVWSAGCASGQEAYTAVMVLAEAMGSDAFRERVKIYATDIDEEALTEGRRAVYSAKQIAEVPVQLAERYFDRGSGDLYTFNRDLRRSVIFGRHDLIQDAPIPRVDLLLCRNTLMYFNAEVQARILGHFHFSLGAGGCLVLGRAEMLFSHSTLFQPLDLKRRIFRPIARAAARDRLPTPSGREENVASGQARGLLRDAAFELNPDAQIVIDASGVLVAANAAARRLFQIAETDTGTRLQDLKISYRPTELRTLIDRARQERGEVTQPAVAWEQGGVIRFLDIVVVPLFDDARGLIGMRIDFTDVTPLKTLQDELTRSRHELDTAYEELQSTNEELETTNEELQSTVEELETTNEELQSTNEELETMNEELQSSNEELQTMNDELRHRGAQVNSNNTFLEAVFTGLRSAVVVIDRELRIQVWNAGALELWGVRAGEAQGTAFFNLDIGLPFADLHQPIREVLSGGAAHRELTIASTNRRGRSIRCRVAIAPLRGGGDEISGAILLMDEDDPPAS